MIRNYIQLMKGSTVSGANRLLNILDRGELDVTSKKVFYRCIDLAGEQFTLSNEDLKGIALTSDWLSNNGYSFLSSTSLKGNKPSVNSWLKLIELSKDNFIQVRIESLIDTDYSWFVEVQDRNFSTICTIKLNYIHELQFIVEFFRQY